MSGSIYIAPLINSPSLPGQPAASWPPTTRKVCDVVKTFLTSPLLWISLLASGVIAFTAVIIATGILPLVAALVAILGFTTITASLTGIFWEDLYYQATITAQLALHTLSKKRWPWWNKITDQIILGGQPLQNKGHLKTLIQVEKVAFVAAYLKENEYQNTVFTSPVQPTDYPPHNVYHMRFSVSDLSPMSVQLMKKSSEYIGKLVQHAKASNKRVLIHCKAGRGRSASAVIAYLLTEKEHGIKNLKQAIAFVKKARPQVWLSSGQIKALKNYETYLNTVPH